MAKNAKANKALIEALQHNLEIQNTQLQLHTFEITSLRFLLNIVRPSLIAMMHNAAENENYEQAQNCKDALDKIDLLIQGQIWWQDGEHPEIKKQD